MPLFIFLQHDSNAVHRDIPVRRFRPADISRRQPLPGSSGRIEQNEPAAAVRIREDGEFPRRRDGYLPAVTLAEFLTPKVYKREMSDTFPMAWWVYLIPEYLNIAIAKVSFLFRQNRSGLPCRS
jgi:hypothetical protein